MPDGIPFTVNAPGGGTVTFYLDYKLPNSDALVAATKAILDNAASAAASDGQSGWATFVAIVILFAGLLSGFLAPLHAQADQNECSNYASSIEYAQCLSSKLTELRGQLDRSYRRALETVPNRSPAPSDDRQTTQQLRQHLVQSQAAWQTYVDEICAYAGGVQGGSSIWVTIFQVQCLLKETRSRIDYLEHLPTGG